MLVRSSTVAKFKMAKRLFHREEPKLMDDDPLQFLLSLIGYRFKSHFYVMQVLILIVVCYLQMFNIICVMDIILYKNFTNLGYLPFVLLQQPGCLGMLLIFAYAKEFFHYQEIVFSNFWSISAGDKKTKRRLLRESKIIKLICMMNYGLSVIAHLSLFPLVGDEKHFNFSIVFCEEHLGRWSKVFIFIFYLCMLVIALGTICPLFAIIYVTVHAQFQFDMLNLAIRKIPKEELAGTNRLLNEVQRHCTIYKSISVCAKHHAVIKMVTNTILREIQNVPVLLVAVAGTMSFVAASYFLIFQISPSSNWRMIIILITITSIFVTLCIYGQKITDESNQFHDVTLYNTPWYHWDQQSKMALLMIIMNSRKPLKITCFDLVVLNYELVLSGVRLIYSLLTLSRKFK